ncbi:MAG: oligosaccharyltransferase complex subunit epsilon [Ramalina farinacea]|uniref:Dolichyl-diphosphooligosaccharide--protein glycosyltransferase subunit OST2 n=1 Tax=Ramalina farinacea TaxID=258253 RepID=A0AA43QMF0_9LECA|nr:oligosaccharyltransferase complex subunit epsilon [Ramalina farinacea]
MAPKRSQISSTTTTGVPPIPSSPTTIHTPASSSPSQPPSKSSSATTTRDVLHDLWSRYTATTPQRTKLLDTFMAFLVVVGALQFVYCVVAGNYPFNAFLSGFSATVGQFVLTASLRIQTNPENEGEFGGTISHERAFADFVLGSVILHFFCVNFIN